MYVPVVVTSEISLPSMSALFKGIQNYIEIFSAHSIQGQILHWICIYIKQTTVFKYTAKRGRGLAARVPTRGGG